MQLSNIVAATDESDAGRQAVWTALELASKTGACVSVMHAMPFDDHGFAPALEHLERWVQSDLPPLDPMPRMTYSLAYGLPGIEIGRFAEEVRADLVVVGRKPRTRMARLLVGDTADAVARRSRLPCLFVPPRDAPPAPRAGGGGRLRAGHGGAQGRRRLCQTDRRGARCAHRRAGARW